MSKFTQLIMIELEFKPKPMPLNVTLYHILLRQHKEVSREKVMLELDLRGGLRIHQAHKGKGIPVR